MADPITLRILTDAGIFLEDQALSIIVPGGLGYLGVLKNHAPLVTTLSPGKFTWRRSDGTARTFQVGAGLFEIVQNRVTLLTSEISESGEKI